MPTKQDLELLYLIQRVSPDEIAKRFDVSGRTVRNWMKKLGIPRRGPAHLRAGKSAYWNKGVKQSSEAIEKNRLAHLGSVPHNKNVGRVSFKCCVCNAEVFDKPYRKKHTCSAKCRDIMLKRTKGEDHWNYKGEESASKQRQRNWSQYKAWRISVFRRDNFKCLKCGKIGGRLTAHHINSFAKHVEQRFDITNGATLCWPCHWHFHRTYGHKISTIEQFSEWITKS